MAADLVITNVRIFDGTRVVDADSVLIIDGRIDRLDHAIAAPSGATVVFCTPGLVAELREAVRGRDDHADFRSSGVGATAPGGHPSQLVQWGIYPEFPTLAGLDQVESFVADRVAEGSDYLKIIIEDGSTFGIESPHLSPVVVRALVEAAHAAGLRTVAHVSTHADADLAIEAGVDGLAHLFIDRPPTADFASRVVAGGMFVTPTLSVYEAYTGVRRELGYLDHPRLAPYLDERGRKSIVPDPEHDFTMTPPTGISHQHAFAATAALHEAGVPILAGTDAATGRSVHGFTLHGELAALVDAGLPPAAALTAATAAPADAYGLADRGRIQPGLRADLLLVDGDPTVDITATRETSGVWKGGVLLDRESRRVA